MSGFAEKLKNYDSHSSVSKEFRVYTVQGAVLSVATLLGKLFSGSCDVPPSGTVDREG
jgi:hypothetical protein